jgi:porin
MPSERWTINSFLLTTQDSSTTSGFDNLDDGWTWSTEVYHQHDLGGLPGGLMGAFTYSFDGDFTNLNGKYVPGSGGLVPITQDDNWAFNFNGWQYLHMEEPGAGPVDVTNGIADHQGFGVFARTAFADTDTNPVKFFISGGLGGRGVLPGRDDDTFGLSYFYTSLEESRLTQLLDAQDHSQGFEAYYNIALSPAASLTADLQVLDSPFTLLDTAVLSSFRLSLRF